jgi:hypothetical protein
MRPFYEWRGRRDSTASVAQGVCTLLGVRLAVQTARLRSGIRGVERRKIPLICAYGSSAVFFFYMGSAALVRILRPAE